MDESIEGFRQSFRRSAPEREGRFERELAADDGADLSDLLAGAEPIEARHQRRLQRGRHHVGRERLDRGPTFPVTAQLSSFKNRFGQFLDK